MEGSVVGSAGNVVHVDVHGEWIMLWVALQWLYIAVYVLLLLQFLEGGKVICLAEGRIQRGLFIYIANFSLWFMVLLIHKVAKYITAELS